MLTDSDKEYEAVMLLGVETDTQDTSGTVLESKPTEHLTEEEVLSVIQTFVGQIQQIPPMYSALKVNGQKLCDLARAGITVERKAREITVYGIDIVSVELPRVTMRVKCSKGTYIRTICHDIGQKLGCGAAMEHLTRTRAAGYTLDQALTLAEIQMKKDEGALEEILRPVDEVFTTYKALYTNIDGHRMLMNGNALYPNCFKNVEPEHFHDLVRVYDKDGHFCAIYKYNQERECFKPEKMFLSSK